MAASFVHLHVHSQYSMLDGAIRLDGLVERCGALDMPAVALTDHANMFGAVQLVKACKGTDVRPILGCELAVTTGKMEDPAAPAPGHLVLLAASQDGYRNLVHLVSRAWVDGLVNGHPRIDLGLLRERADGLVALTGCMGGLVPQTVLMKGEEAGRASLATLRDIFGRERLFVELEDHGFPEQIPLNDILVESADALELPVVATNCCHFLERKDARAQLVLQCISAGRTLGEMQAAHHGSDEMYVKSAGEMLERFSDRPAALEATLRVAELCAGKANPLAAPKLPRFAVPEGATEESHVRRLAEEGLALRFREHDRAGIRYDASAYRERLHIELDVICQMGFAGYFLIVQDFINHAKQHHIPVGPGRGSGAGSLVAWGLRITDIDPIPYGLLFERFLNPERVSMPDFDVDFCMSTRDRVIDYVREKYGTKSVGQIATFHLLKSRSVVRDVGRVMGMAPADAGRIATLVPEPVQGKSVPIDDALTQEPRLKAAYDESEEIRTLLDTARTLEDLTRHAGMHAAGVVISEGPLWDHVPVFCPEPNTYVTQFHKDDVEAAGLVKFDFLGLKTLTVIDIAVKLIEKRPDRAGEPFDVSRIPLTDPATYALLQSGETTNVFQLESSGMQSLFKQLKPDCFEDIVAAVALYRPGPLGSGMVEDFVQRKHGRVKVAYPHESLEPVLKDTYGVIVYQEQVMQIARDMAGYSLGGADLLRRAMGKKKAEEMAKQKATFIAGATGRGFAEADADRVFELMAYFAGYGFNKSHSAAYALITYQTAYLKAHYPVEFACATLSADRDKTDKVVRTVAEARSMGITVLPPDVNESNIDFSVVYDPDPSGATKRPEGQPVCVKGKVRDPMRPRIRFGLGGVKGIGESALEAMFEVRDGTGGANGGPTSRAATHGATSTSAPSTRGQVTSSSAGTANGEGPEVRRFDELFDFCSRVDLRRVNKGVVESLVQCGAFDAVHQPMHVTRAQAFAAIDAAIERGKKEAQERASGQTNLFELFGAATGGAASGRPSRPPGADFPKLQPWDTRELLTREKASLGFYVSGHPLDRYASELRRFCNATTDGLASAQERQAVTVGGSVEGYRERNTKTGGRIAFFDLEDPFGRVEVIVRPRVLETAGVRDVLVSGEPVLVTGTVQFEQNRGGPEGSGGGGDEAEAPKIVLDSVSRLAETLSKKTRLVCLRLMVERVDRLLLQSLRDTLKEHPGPCPVTLELASRDKWAVSMSDTGLSVSPSDALLASLERLFGEKVCELR